MIKHPYLEEIEKPPLEELGTPIKTESGIAFDMGTRAIAYGGSRLAIGRDDGSVTLGNAIARQGGPWEPLGKHPASVRAMAFSSEQPWLLTGAKDGSLRVWDVATKAPLQTLPGHEARVNSVSIGPGNLAASAGPDGIRISDLASGKLLRHIDTGGVWVSDVHFSPDGHAVVAALLDGSLGTWDAVTGTRRWRVDAEEGWCATARYHPEGRMVASGHELGAVVLWDAAKGTRLRKTRTDGKTAWQTGCRSVHALAWSPTGDVLAVCFGDAVRVYDTQLTSGRGPGWLLPLDWADYYT
jgi:WD40 repeat protein